MLFAEMLWSCELLVKTITILDTCVTNRILKRFTFEVRQLCTSLFPIVLEDKQSSQIKYIQTVMFMNSCQGCQRVFLVFEKKERPELNIKRDSKKYKKGLELIN